MVTFIRYRKWNASAGRSLMSPKCLGCESVKTVFERGGLMKTIACKRASVVIGLLWVLCVLVSCGSGGGGGGGSTTVVETKPAKGAVTLPEGSAASIADVRIQGFLGEYPVDGDGTFEMEEPSGGPALVMLTDKNGNVMLLGYVDADSGEPGSLSALSTAAVLMFMDIGGYHLPPENWQAILDLLESQQAVKDLAHVIEEQLAIDSAALQNSDAVIKAAIETARTALVPADLLDGTVARKPAVAAYKTKGDTTPPANIGVITQNPTSGVQIAPSENSDGVMFTNEYRRHCYYWVYYTGYQDTGGVDHRLSSALWEKMGSGYLKSTNGLSGVIGTTIDFIWEKIPYKPVTAGPVVLTQMPGDAKQAYYKAVVVGAGSYPLLDTFPDWMADNVNRTEFVEMSLLMSTVTVVKDYYLPIAFALAPTGTANALTGKDLSDFCAGIVGLVVKTGVNVSQNISLGDYDGAVKAMIKATLSDGTLRKALCQYIAKTLIKGALTEAALEKMGTSANNLNKILKGFDLAIMGVDVGGVTKDLYNSNKADYFDIVAVKPNVHIEPGLVTLQPGDDYTFTAIAGTVTGDVIEYRWSVPGITGKLRKVDDTELSNAITTSGQSIVYVASDSAVDKSTDTLTVDVYRKQITDQGVVQQKIGSDQAVITISKVPTAMFTYVEKSMYQNDEGVTVLNIGYFILKKISGAPYYEITLHDNGYPYKPSDRGIYNGGHEMRTYTFDPSPGEHDSFGLDGAWVYLFDKEHLGTLGGFILNHISIADDEMVFLVGYNGASMTKFYENYMELLWQDYSNANTQAIWDAWLEKARHWTVSYVAP